MFSRIGKTTLLLLTVVGCGRSTPSVPENVTAGQTMLASETSPGTQESITRTGPRPLDQGEPRRSQSPMPTIPPELRVRPYHDWGLSETVEDSLGRIGAPAVPALTRLLRHPVAARRVQAANILARIGPQAAEAVPALAEALEDPDADVRKAAARALGQIGPEAEEAVGPLLRLLEQVDNGAAMDQEGPR